MFKWSRAVLQIRMNGTSSENGFMRPARVPYKVLYALLFTLIVVIIVLLLPGNLSREEPTIFDNIVLVKPEYPFYEYNNTYPLTTPTYVGENRIFHIGLVADQDENSKVDSVTWGSWLKTGTLTLHHDRTLSVKWDTDLVPLRSHISEKGRGVELSELIVFNGRLYTVDDRSGIIFEIVSGHLVPWVILEDGPGTVDKGFKAEWMAVKDRQLYIGGLGKEWTTQQGVFKNDHPQYVKVVDALGLVEHRPWANFYNKMKASAGINSPGYIIHESACWSSLYRKWYFLPRRASKESYDDVEDEHRATNLLITADEAFADIQVQRIGTLNQYRGYSTFKFVPGTKDTMIIAIKSEENKGTIASYISAFDLDGHSLMREEKIGDVKFEGLEFI